MDGSLISLLFLGFILGIKHAIEPDHVIAVSNIASQSKKLWRPLLAGVFWGIGHTFTLFIVGIAIILMKITISTTMEMSFELLVGILIIYLGGSSYLSIIKKRPSEIHQSSKQNNRKIFVKSMFIGIIHGLAGSAAMVILTISYVETVWESVIYILVFGLGTVLGMMLFTTAFGLAFVWEKINVNSFLGKAVGVLSMGFGFYYIYDVVVTQDLLSLWFQYWI